MKTIHGYLWNPAKDKKPWLVSKEEADYWHLYQTLIGDATDGYKGCPGVGKESAPEILSSRKGVLPYPHQFKRGPRKGEWEVRWQEDIFEDRWKAVVSWFHKAGLTEEDALQQARVARICRAEDYDFKSKEVKLWQPI